MLHEPRSHTAGTGTKRGNMKSGFTRNIICLVLSFLTAGMTVSSHAQDKKIQTDRHESLTAAPAGTSDTQDGREMMRYIVEGKDTIFIDEIKASKVYSRLPKMKGREWRQYYRLVHNFSKAYPYALVAKKLVVEADSTIAADNLKRGKREKYINSVQSELFSVFESQLRGLTVSQGALLMKLIDREVGKSSYKIIKDYKSGITAGFWQGIAKMFGSDLKKPYDPEGEDEATEELVVMWENGDFQAFYWSLFWKDPPEMPIPEKYK